MQRFSQKIRNRYLGRAREEKAQAEAAAAVNVVKADEGGEAAVELSDVDLDFSLQKPPYEVSHRGEDKDRAVPDAAKTNTRSDPIPAAELQHADGIQPQRFAPSPQNSISPSAEAQAADTKPAQSEAKPLDVAGLSTSLQGNSLAPGQAQGSMKIDLSTIIQQREVEQRGQTIYKVQDSGGAGRPASTTPSKKVEKKKSVDIKAAKAAPPTMLDDAGQANRLKVALAQQFKRDVSKSTKSALASALQMQQQGSPRAELTDKDKKAPHTPQLTTIQPGQSQIGQAANRVSSISINNQSKMDFSDSESIAKAFNKAVVSSMKSNKLQNKNLQTLQSYQHQMLQQRGYASRSNISPTGTDKKSFMFLSPKKSTQKEKARASPTKQYTGTKLSKASTANKQNGYSKQGSTLKGTSTVAPISRNQYGMSSTVTPLKRKTTTASQAANTQKKQELTRNLRYGIFSPEKKKKTTKKYGGQYGQGAASLKTLNSNKYNMPKNFSRSYMSSMSRSPQNKLKKKQADLANQKKLAQSKMNRSVIGFTSSFNKKLTGNRSNSSIYGLAQRSIYGPYNHASKSINNKLAMPSSQSRKLNFQDARKQTGYGIQYNGGGTSSSRQSLPLTKSTFNLSSSQHPAHEVLERRKANNARYNNYIRTSQSPAHAQPATASPARLKKSISKVQSISKLTEITIDHAIPTKKTKKTDDDAPSKDLYSFPSLGQIRKMTPMRPQVQQEKAVDKSFSLSANSEVFMSMSAYDTKNVQNNNSHTQNSPGARSPTFIMESDRDVEDLVVTTSHLERTSHFNVEERGKDWNGAKKEEDPKAEQKRQEQLKADERKLQLKQKFQDYKKQRNGNLSTVAEAPELSSTKPKGKPQEAAKVTASTGNLVNQRGRSELEVIDEGKDSSRSRAAENRPEELEELASASLAAHKDPLGDIGRERNIRSSLTASMSPQKLLSRPRSEDFFSDPKQSSNRHRDQDSRNSQSSFKVMDITKLSQFNESDFSEMMSEAQSVRDDPVALKDVEAAKEEGQSKEHIIDLLTKEELAKFGNRVPNGFKKLGILGRGTTAMIWLAENQMTGETVALKQYPKNDRGQVDERTKMELSFYEQIFDGQTTKTADRSAQRYSASAGQPASLKDQGIRYILKLYEHFDEYKDLWLCYEVGKRPLAERLCTYKELQYKGETIYNMKHQFFYKLIQTNLRGLKQLIKLVAKFLVSLQSYNMVHGDLKPANMLVEFDAERTTVLDLRIKDFQSSFKFDELSKVKATSPWYLPPEVLDYADQRATNPGQSCQSLSSISSPWSLDVFSLGVTLLEIATGYPVWMSNKCKATNLLGRSTVGMGIFGVPTKSSAPPSLKSIAAQQVLVIKKLQHNLKKWDTYGLADNADFVDLLSQMLDVSPAKRISPLLISQHKFCQGV